MERSNLSPCLLIVLLLLGCVSVFDFACMHVKAESLSENPSVFVVEHGKFYHFHNYFDDYYVAKSGIQISNNVTERWTEIVFGLNFTFNDNNYSRWTSKLPFNWRVQNRSNNAWLGGWTKLWENGDGSRYVIFAIEYMLSWNASRIRFTPAMNISINPTWEVSNVVFTYRMENISIDGTYGNDRISINGTNHLFPADFEYNNLMGNFLHITDEDSGKHVLFEWDWNFTYNQNRYRIRDVVAKGIEDHEIVQVEFHYQGSLKETSLFWHRMWWSDPSDYYGFVTSRSNVNGLHTYHLNTTADETAWYTAGIGVSDTESAVLGIIPFRRKQDGTLSQLAWDVVAQVSFPAWGESDTEAIKTSYWTCPKVYFPSGSTLQINVYGRLIMESWRLLYTITPTHDCIFQQPYQLNDTFLEPSTWTVKYHCITFYLMGYYSYNWRFGEDKVSYIDNLEWSIPEEDYVDSDESDLDASADKGFHSNFTAQRFVPESVFDTLSELDTGGVGSSVQELWVNGFTSNETDWTEEGSTPYLDAIDYDTNYIWDDADDSHYESRFNFTDQESYLGVITDVEFCLYTTQDSGDNGEIEVFIYNSTDGYSIGQFVPVDGSWGWINTSVLSILSNLTEINVAQLRVRAEKVGGADILYVDAGLLRITYLDPNYELDLEIQWSNLNTTRTFEELCIKTGTLDAEDILVDYWNSSSSSWINIITDLNASTWNNVSITLTVSVITLRYKGGSESGDVTNSTWEIDCALMHTWDAEAEEEIWDCNYIGLNSTIAGNTTEIKADWSDLNASEGLSHNRFCWNNTGSFVNGTWMDSWNGNWSERIVTLNITIRIVCARFYVNDTSGIEHESTWLFFTTYLPPNQYPIALFFFTPPNPRRNENVTFNATESFDPDGTIVSYAWDFGDGDTGSGMILNHTFAYDEAFNVTLTVTDDDALTGSCVESITPSATDSRFLVWGVCIVIFIIALGVCKKEGYI